jgi:hypothetical protein
LALREEAIGDPALVENLDGAGEAFRASHFRRFWLRLAIMRHDSGLAASPPVRDILRVSGAGILLSPSAVDGQPPRKAAARRVRRFEDA